MAVTLVPTPGAANANTYVSLAAADAYLADHLRVAEWTAATVDDKSRALIQATEDLDELVEWDIALLGWPTSTTQALRFPSSSVIRRWGDAWYANDVIPDFIADACCEQALAVLKSDRRGDPATRGITSLGAGPLTIQFDPTGAAQVRQPLADAAWQKIRAWTLNGPADAPGALRTVDLVRA